MTPGIGRLYTESSALVASSRIKMSGSMVMSDRHADVGLQISGLPDFPLSLKTLGQL